MRKRLLAGTAALMVGFTALAPAAALAQSAGDNQYQDPLGGSSGGSTGKKTHSGSSSPSGSSSTPSPAPAASSTPSTSSAPAATPSASAPAQQLPRTGGDPLIVGLFGGALLLTGGGLRLILPRPR